jgi:NAD(P)-dependent dehydrogenase (short-subunit alcohol dehydrogenase family)
MLEFVMKSTFLNTDYVLLPGSRGIGLYAAEAFLRAGCAKVIIAARDATNLKIAADQLNALPGVSGKAVPMAANLGRTDQIEQFVKDLATETEKDGGHGGVDILVANAAASWGGPFETFEDWKSIKTLDLNVRGVFNLVRFMVPLLARPAKHEDPSRVILTSSVGGIIVPQVGDFGAIMYSASKAAVHHLGRNLALELAPKNITTNVVAPGLFATRLADLNVQHHGGKDTAGANNPFKRLGKSEDIAGVMIYLCSRAGSYINGEDISVDGGHRLNLGRHPDANSDLKAKI